MICLDIPGAEKKEIHHLVFDYNGTIAIDGILIPGVKKAIRSLAGRAKIHVITADTFGFVTQQVSDINCEVAIIPQETRHKASWISSRSSGCNTLCAWAMAPTIN